MGDEPFTPQYYSAVFYKLSLAAAVIEKASNQMADAEKGNCVSGWIIQNNLVNMEGVGCALMHHGGRDHNFMQCGLIHSS